MLIPVMIPSLEDELMYSWMIRLAKANGFDDTEASALRLFSKLYVHPNSNKSGIFEPHYDCHDDISGFLMATGMPMDKIPEFYLDTNIYTGIAPFMQPMRQSNYINRSVYPNDLGFKSLMFKYGNSTITNAYICPECAREDIEKHGTFYLHRMHHLPSVKCCANHGCSLYKYNGIKSYELDNIDAYEDINEDITESDLKYASFYKDFLNAKISTHSEEIALAVRTRINNMGYQKPDYPKLVEKIKEDGYDNLFNKELKHFLDINLTGVRGHSLDFQMFMSLICYLFKDVNDFISMLESDTSTEDNFYDTILENNYSLLCKYNDHLVVLKNNDGDNVFMVNPYGFIIGWRDPLEVSALDEHDMYANLVENISEGGYSIIDTFVSTDEKVTLRHNTCGREYKVRAGAFLLSNSRCECEKNLTIERAQARLDESSGGEYELLQYTNQHEDCVVRHKCGQEITKMYALIQRYPICPICTPIERAKRHEEVVKRQKERLAIARANRRDKVSNTYMLHDKFHDEAYVQEQIKALVGDEYEIVADFNDVQSPAKLLHKSCGNVITMTPSAFIQGRRCQCQEMLKGKDFEEYVKHASNGLYKINPKAVLNYDKYEIINTQTKEKQVLSKCKIVQELYRPTDSNRLPCPNRNWDINPYVETNTTMVMKALKSQFAPTDFFMFKDINCTSIPLTENQIRAAITSLITRSNSLYKIEDGTYCLTDYEPTNYEVVFNYFCTRNGHRVGVLRSQTLLDAISGSDITDKAFVRTNTGKPHRANRHVDIRGITVSDLNPSIPITDDNWAVMTMIEFARLKAEKAELYYDKIRDFAKEHNLSYEDCMNFMPDVDRINLIKYNLKKIYGIYDETERKTAISEKLENRFRDALIENFNPEDIFSSQDIFDLGFTKSQIIRCSRILIEKGELIRVKLGFYAFPEHPTAVHKVYEKLESVDTNEFLEYLKSDFGINTPIVPEDINYKSATKAQIWKAMKELMERGELTNIAKGLYTLKGSNLDVDGCLNQRYLFDTDGRRIGYETLDTFTYSIGLLKPKPTNTYVMSNLRLNRAKRHSLPIRRDDSVLYVRSPKYEITDDNYKILPMLDFLVKYPNHISYDPIKEMRKYAKKNKITYDMCLPYIDKYRDIVNGRLKAIFDIT